MDSALSSDASSEVLGEEGFALAIGGGKARREEEGGRDIAFGDFSCWQYRFTLLLCVVWIFCFYFSWFWLLTLTLLYTTQCKIANKNIYLLYMYRSVRGR